MNVAKEGPEFVSVAVGTSRTFIRANEDTVRRVVRAYAEGVQIFKTNKPAALRMIQNQLKVKEPDIQEDTYSQFREYLEYPPYVSKKGMESVLAEIADKEPAAKAPSRTILSTCVLSPSWRKRPAVSSSNPCYRVFAETTLVGADQAIFVSP